MKNVNYMNKLADTYHFRCILMLIITLMSATFTKAEEVVCPILPWEEEFVFQWGLNRDIAWMAEDISEFDVNYNDGSRAGIWGLTATTARFYGLTVDDTKDERFDITKATGVVVRYMYHLIAINRGDTLAAITMYVNSKFVADGDTAFKRPKNSARYIDTKALDKLYAAYKPTTKSKTITPKPVKDLKPVVEQKPVVEPKNVVEPKPVIDLKPVADPKPVIETEPTTKQEPTAEQEPTVEQEEEHIPVTVEIIYIVQKGDNLSVIAHNHGVKVNDLRKWNNIQGSIIIPDQKIKIYVTK